MWRRQNTSGLSRATGIPGADPAIRSSERGSGVMVRRWGGILILLAVVPMAAAPVIGQGAAPDDIEHWVALFEDPERVKWQHPGIVLSILGVGGGAEDRRSGGRNRILHPQHRVACRSVRKGLGRRHEPRDASIHRGTEQEVPDHQRGDGSRRAERSQASRRRGGSDPGGQHLASHRETRTVSEAAGGRPGRERPRGDRRFSQTRVAARPAARREAVTEDGDRRVREGGAGSSSRKAWRCPTSTS